MAFSTSKPSASKNRRLESIASACERTGVSRWTFHRAIADGRLTGYRMSPRIIRLDPAEVDALFQPMPNYLGQVG